MLHMETGVYNAQFLCKMVYFTSALCVKKANMKMPSIDTHKYLNSETL